MSTSTSSSSSLTISNRFPILFVINFVDTIYGHTQLINLHLQQRRRTCRCGWGGYKCSHAVAAKGRHGGLPHPRSTEPSLLLFHHVFWWAPGTFTEFS